MATKQSKKGKKVFVGFCMMGGEFDYADYATSEADAKSNFDFYWEVYLPVPAKHKSIKVGIVAL